MERPLPITLDNEDTGAHYTLEFTRATIKKAEKAGFTINCIAEGKIVSGYSDLFYYAFLAHHPQMKQTDTDRILFEELGGVSEELTKRLIELYSYPYNALVEETEKNSMWRIGL